MNLKQKAGIASCAFLFVLTASVLVSAASATTDEGWVKLFNGKDLTGWKRYLDVRNPKTKDVDLDKFWTVKDGVIYCDGSINGYIVTEKEHGNYVLKLEWRWGESAKEK